MDGYIKLVYKLNRKKLKPKWKNYWNDASIRLTRSGNAAVPRAELVVALVALLLGSVDLASSSFTAFLAHHLPLASLC